MVERLRANNNPNFFFLNYDGHSYTIRDFLAIPKYFFIEQIIERRKPLSASARRAGWIGCNIVMEGIPEFGIDRETVGVSAAEAHPDVAEGRPVLPPDVSQQSKFGGDLLIGAYHDTLGKGVVESQVTAEKPCPPQSDLPDGTRSVKVDAGFETQMHRGNIADAQAGAGTRLHQNTGRAHHPPGAVPEPEGAVGKAGKQVVDRGAHAQHTEHRADAGAHGQPVIHLIGRGGDQGGGEQVGFLDIIASGPAVEIFQGHPEKRATVFIIAFNGLKQHAGFVAQSQAQQQILINILEQAPYLKPEAAIVLLVDDASNSPFESSVIFRAALKWTYNKQKIEALQCSEKTGNCKFGAQGIEGLAAAASAQKSLVPYENALLFSYSTGKGAALMEQIPPKYQQGGITPNYQPYRHILAYAPFPSRPEKAFDFAPDPVRLSPATWIGNEQTLNDRKVCTVSHSGQCSLQFWGDGDPARFEQEIKMSGNAGERLELSFWGKSQDVAEGKIPTAKITLFYGDGSEDEFIVPGQFSADWSLQEFIFETSKPYTRFLITLFPNPQPGVIWLDDLRLIKDNLEIGIENPSFEK